MKTTLNGVNKPMVLMAVCQPMVDHLVTIIAKTAAQIPLDDDEQRTFGRCIETATFTHDDGTEIPPYTPTRRDMLTEIFALLDGREWSPDTLDAIADVFERRGFLISEPAG